MKTQAKLERYLKISRFLEDALSLCNSPSFGVTPGVSHNARLGPKEERKYALVLLYLGNFFMRLAIWEETDPAARIPYSFSESRGKDEPNSATERRLFNTFDSVHRQVETELDGRGLHTKEIGLIENFFDCDNCVSEKHELHGVKDMLILAEMCFLASHDILKNFIYIFDKAFLSNRRGLLYYKLAISGACRPTPSQALDCKALKLYKKALALFDDAADTYAAHQREDQENIWAFADTCVDRANLCYQMHKFKLRSLTALQSSSENATEAFARLLSAEYVAEFHHQLSTFLSTKECLKSLVEEHENVGAPEPSKLIEWLRKDISKMEAEGWSPEKMVAVQEKRFGRESKKLEKLRDAARSRKTEAARRNQPAEKMKAEEAINTINNDIGILAQVVELTKQSLQLTADVDLREIYEEGLIHAEACERITSAMCVESQGEGQENCLQTRMLKEKLENDLQKADRFYIDALKMYSTEHDAYRKDYPLNPNLYYFRDEFSDSDEHWKQAVHYKKRRRKDRVNVVPVPSRVAIKRVRNYIYSNRPVFSRRVLAQAFSATGSDRRTSSGTVYFEKFIGASTKVVEDKDESAPTRLKKQETKDLA